MEPGADPFDGMNEDEGPRPFAIGFDKASGDSLVFGGVLVGALFVFISFSLNQPFLAVGALIPLGVAFWHYPMIDRRTPQFGASSDGLFVDRLGFIDWAEIAKFELQHSSVRNIRLVRLEVSLHRPLKDTAIKRQVFPLWKSVMTRCWSLRRDEDGSEKLVVQLHLLTKDPDQVLARLRAFRNV